MLGYHLFGSCQSASIVLIAFTFIKCFILHLYLIYLKLNLFIYLYCLATQLEFDCERLFSIIKKKQTLLQFVQKALTDTTAH